MDLKELLGEELYQQVSEKAGDKKLVVVNDGNWFPKEKFDEVNNDKKALKEQLTDRDNQLKELGDKAAGNAELTQEIDRLKAANAETVDKYEKQIAQQTFDSKLNDALRNAKVRNPKAVKALLDAENIKLDGDKLLGLDDQLGALKESDAYLFASEEKPVLGGRTPHTPSGQPSTGLTKEDFAKMTYAERTQLFSENPEQFNKLNS